MKMIITLAILVAICHCILADVSHLSNSHEDRHYLPPLPDKDQTASGYNKAQRHHGQERKTKHSTHYKISKPKGLPDPPLIAYQPSSISPADRFVTRQNDNLFIPAGSERIVYASAPNSIFHTQINVQSQDNDYNAPPFNNNNNGQNTEPFIISGFGGGGVSNNANGFNAGIGQPTINPADGNAFQIGFNGQNGANGQNGFNGQNNLNSQNSFTGQNSLNGQNGFINESGDGALIQQPLRNNAGLPFQSFGNNGNNGNIPLSFNGNGQNAVGNSRAQTNPLRTNNANNVGNQQPSNNNNSNNFNGNGQNVVGNSLRTNNLSNAGNQQPLNNNNNVNFNGNGQNAVGNSRTQTNPLRNNVGNSQPLNNSGNLNGNGQTNPLRSNNLNNVGNQQPLNNNSGNFNGNGQNVVGNSRAQTNALRTNNLNNPFNNGNNGSLPGTAINSAGRTSTSGGLQRNQNGQGFNNANNFRATSSPNRAQLSQPRERKINYQGVNTITFQSDTRVPTSFTPNANNFDNNAQLGNLFNGNLFGASSQQSTKVVSGNGEKSGGHHSSAVKQTTSKTRHHHHHSHKKQKQHDYNNDNFAYSHSANSPPEVIYSAGDGAEVGPAAKDTTAYADVSAAAGAEGADGHDTDLRDDGYYYGKPSVSFSF